MLYESVTHELRASGSESCGTSSHRAQTPSDPKSSHDVTPRLCPVCKKISNPKRGKKDSDRHILDLHLPDWVCCPHPDCDWHGSRPDALFEHLEGSKECGARPKLVNEFKIYDTDLIIHWLIDKSTPLETVEDYALDLIKENARERGKVDKWGSLNEWRKSKPQRRRRSGGADVPGCGRM